MAHIVADRVRDTSTTTGTGALTLAGSPPTGYRAVSAVCANNDTIYYCIQHQTLNQWEVGLGTSNGGTTLTRTTVLASSNGGAAVNFSAGTKDVFAVFPAGKVPVPDKALPGGFFADSYSLGTISSGTVTPTRVNGNLQHYTNTGAHTLAAPTDAGSYDIRIQITNGASAGAITLTGFNITSGDTYTTTNGDDFFFHIAVHNGFKRCAREKLQ
jgi:hypothetical protein